MQRRLLNNNMPDLDNLQKHRKHAEMKIPKKFIDATDAAASNHILMEKMSTSCVPCKTNLKCKRVPSNAIDSKPLQF